MLKKEKYIVTEEDEIFMKILAQKNFKHDDTIVIAILTCRNKKCKEVTAWLNEHPNAEAEDVLEFIQTLDLSLYP